ncbi:zinc-binding dehydrogenase [Streptomyces sp. NPDC051569]|uniref:zinc-binding dehydrogenase n=1 Tax=Streptomyces sp. NPDC051569 TaxID=3365661 RepID=UPI0037A4EB75
MYPIGEATVMKAAVFHGPLDLRIEDVAIPEPGAGEVLVRVSAAGICGSDAAEYAHGPHMIRPDADGGFPPVVLGHEFVGTVARTGTGVEGLVPGATVVCGAGVSCGDCRMCRAGRTNLCRSYHTVGYHRDGGMAQYAAVPAGILHDVSDSGLSTDTLALAQPLAVAVHSVRRSGLRSGQDAVVVGAGGIGAFLTYVAAATGARVLVIDLNKDRLRLARDLGATAVALAGEAPLAEQLAELGFDPDVLFEVSGSAQGLEAILGVARPGAVIVPVGLQKKTYPADLLAWTLREYTVVGTVAHVFAEDIPEAVRLLAARAATVGWDDIAEDVIPLSELLADGLLPLSQGNPRQIKTIVDPWTDTGRPADHRVSKGTQ